MNGRDYYSEGIQECRKDAMPKAEFFFDVSSFRVAGARESPAGSDYQGRTEERRAGWIHTHPPRLWEA